MDFKGKILVSACLVGIKCRYDGKSAKNEKVVEFLKDRNFVPVCPEQLGGLCTPRTPAEINSGDGRSVLDGKERIITKNGDDVTKEYLKGAFEALEIGNMTGCGIAILKEKSPSCGVNAIYDGEFSGRLKRGCGVFCALLQKKGIKAVGENDVFELKP